MNWAVLHLTNRKELQRTTEKKALKPEKEWDKEVINWGVREKDYVRQDHLPLGDKKGPTRQITSLLPIKF